LVIVALTAQHDTASFRCSAQPEIERFVRECVRDEVAANGCRCFVLVEASRPDVIAGFSTLSAAVVSAKHLRADSLRALPYPNLPAILLGRMGVDDRFAGRRYGTTLIAHAYRKALEASESVGHVGMIVDPKDDELVGYYAKHGFERLSHGSRRMFVSVERMRNVCAHFE
jgi:GNAT superfamily N-acetyltransferase